MREEDLITFFKIAGEGPVFAVPEVKPPLTLGRSGWSPTCGDDRPELASIRQECFPWSKSSSESDIFVETILSPVKLLVANVPSPRKLGHLQSIFCL
jgi:hypothetical protein